MKKLLICFVYILASLKLAAAEASSPKVEFKAFYGEEARPYKNDIAKIRTEMFREFPYLYDGSEEYEKEYLETYFKCPKALVILAFVNGKVRGFSSSIPLDSENDEITQPFRDSNIDMADYYYIGEVMLRPELQKMGLTHKFYGFHFDAFLKGGYKAATFLTVQRDADHPQRPKDYTPIDGICKYFGFRKDPKLIGEMEWKRVDTGKDEINTVDYWVLSGDALERHLKKAAK